MVWQLVGVSHQVLLSFSLLPRDHCSGLAVEAGPSAPVKMVQRDGAVLGVGGYARFLS
jgi:hypothetical protein